MKFCISWPMHRVVSKCPVPIQIARNLKFWRQIRIQRLDLLYIRAAKSGNLQKIVFFVVPVAVHADRPAWQKFGLDFVKFDFPNRERLPGAISDDFLCEKEKMVRSTLRIRAKW